MEAREIVVAALAAALLMCGILAAKWPEPHVAPPIRVGLNHR